MSSREKRIEQYRRDYDVRSLAAMLVDHEDDLERVRDTSDQRAAKLKRREEQLRDWAQFLLDAADEADFCVICRQHHGRKDVDEECPLYEFRKEFR